MSCNKSFCCLPKPPLPRDDFLKRSRLTAAPRWSPAAKDLPQGLAPGRPQQINRSDFVFGLFAGDIPDEQIVLDLLSIRAEIAAIFLSHLRRESKDNGRKSDEDKTLDQAGFADTVHAEQADFFLQLHGIYRCRLALRKRVRYLSMPLN
jgi:hypothetical protein